LITCHCLPVGGWEGFNNRDKSEDLPDIVNRSKLSGRKALDFILIPESPGSTERWIK
jgi:hypothetical protein